MKILLVCSAGMSTSLLVTKMEKVAADRGIDAKVWAVAGNAAKDNFAKCDVVLVGPQMKFMAKKFKELTDKPVDVIDMRVYGRMDGEAALNQAIDLLK